MPKYVIYARKSTESEDRQVLSIDSQVRELQSLAAHQGVTIGEVLTESKSAKAPGRPVFTELMRRVNRGQIRGIVTWKMDRLARNHLDAGLVLQALADARLERVITSDRTYTPDGNDRFIGGFEFGIGTKFIDDLRANTKRGLRERLNRGWITGQPPVGYLNDVVNKTIIRDPERFPLIRRMWELVLDGSMRPDAVLRIANEEWGFRTRRTRHFGDKSLSRSTFYKILANPFYAGVIRLRDGRTYVGKHERMVTLEEFDRVQRLLDRPWRQRPKRLEFAFTGLLHCATCGCGITAEEHRKRSGRYVYYHCTRRRQLPTGTCREPAISELDLVRQLASPLGNLAIDPDTLEWIRADGEAKVREDLARASTVRLSLERDLKALEREEEALLSLRLRELVTDDVFTRKRAQIHARRVDAQAKLAAPERTAEELHQLVVTTLTFAAKAKEAFLAGPAQRQRTILEAIGSDYVLRNRQVEFKLGIPFDQLSARIRVSEPSRERVPSGGQMFEPVDFRSAERQFRPSQPEISARLRLVDDVRKWIEGKGPDFRLPDLSAGTTQYLARPA